MVFSVLQSHYYTLGHVFIAMSEYKIFLQKFLQELVDAWWLLVCIPNMYMCTSIYTCIYMHHFQGCSTYLNISLLHLPYARNYEI